MFVSHLNCAYLNANNSISERWLYFFPDDTFWPLTDRMVIWFPLKFHYYKFLLVFPFSGIRKLKKAAVNCECIDIQWIDSSWNVLPCLHIAIFQTMTRGWQFSLNWIQSWRCTKYCTKYWKKIWESVRLSQESKPPVRFKFSSALSCKREWRCQSNYSITSCGNSGTEC